jgi:hypothetical protein
VFSTDAAEAVAHADIQFIAVGTPPGEDGSADLQYVLAVAKSIASHMGGYKLIVNKSTVPVGTADKVSQRVTEVLAERAQALPFAIQAAGKSAHAKTWNGIRGQLFPLGGAELVRADLRRTQGVVAQNDLGGARIDQDKNRTHALGVLLHRVFLQVSVKNRFATAKAPPVMQRRV